MNATSEGCVVDTDVLSYLFRRDSRVGAFRPYLEGKVVIVSFMSLAELERWTLRRNWGQQRRAELEAFLGSFAHLLPDRALCRTWAEVMEQARQSGRPIQVADAWIAATALALRVPLLTNNRADYVGVAGLTILPS